MKTFLFLIFICTALNGLGQCDSLVKNNYDKFEKRDTYNTIKTITLTKGGYSFEIKPIRHTSDYITIEIKIKNNSDGNPSYISNIAEVIFLFEDGETLKRHNIYGHEYNDNGSYKTVSNNQGIFEITLNVESSAYREEWVGLADKIMNRFCTKKVNSIRFSGIGVNNIDIDLTLDQKNYLVNIFNCFKKQ